MKFIIILLYLSSLVYSQGQDEKIKLKQVKVFGNLVTSENTIIFTSGLREGQAVTPADFPRAIKRLWQLGLFQDVQIEYDDESDEGLSLSINVKENYILGQISFEGNKKIKDRKFEDEIPLSKGQRIKPNTIRETKELIRDLYIEKGYLNVEIASELSANQEETILFGGKGKELIRDIIFTIKENKKIRIGRILFKGNESFSDFRLRWQMKEIKQQSWYFFWRLSFDNKKFEEDMNLISTFYRNKGYRDFYFVSDSIEYSKDGEKMNIVLTVKEGPLYRYRNFSWEGMTLFDQEILGRTLALDKGEKYSDEDFNMAVFSRVQGLYLDRGYIYSRVEPKITPVEKDSLDIHFMITENHKVYIDQISISGNTRTRENVIRRQLRVFPGDVYNQELIARSYREVMMLNYFANAAPNIIPVSEDKINIEFTVEEKPAGQASANMGYSQYYGLTGGGGLSLPNFRGKGQSFSFSYNEGINSGSQSTYMYQGYNVNRPKSRRA